uniref:Uncharacterized protein n=1 Tax=Aegilops tauschii subsp. strangulata TaxID=200361 RepID=A0A452XBX6_AEGTS
MEYCSCVESSGEEDDQPGCVFTGWRRDVPQVFTGWRPPCAIPVGLPLRQRRAIMKVLYRLVWTVVSITMFSRILYSVTQYYGRCLLNAQIWRLQNT